MPDPLEGGLEASVVMPSEFELELRAELDLSYPLIFSKAKMQLEVGALLRRFPYDES
jgi:hypothetical protein